jgi:hypothetical protein
MISPSFPQGMTAAFSHRSLPSWLALALLAAGLVYTLRPLTDAEVRAAAIAEGIRQSRAATVKWCWDPTANANGTIPKTAEMADQCVAKFVK